MEETTTCMWCGEETTRWDAGMNACEECEHAQDVAWTTSYWLADRYVETPMHQVVETTELEELLGPNPQ